MPPIKIDHILSFSSEDPVHTANNILSSDTSKKWKCKTTGEKQAIVVLQLEKASQVTAIDIGNEHSAYVEVLVSRSSNKDDFKVLLVTSAFMTPLEARQSQNVNKVRMFTQDQLSKPECNEKWDRVKIICTQPFNKHVQFGLSFVTLHSNDTKTTGTPILTKMGNFLIRPDSPDNLTIGNLFAKRKELKQEDKPTTAAAAIRDAASSLMVTGSTKCKPKLIKKDSNLTPQKPVNDGESARKDRNRGELFYTEDDEKGNEKIDKIMKKKEEEDKLKRKNEEKVVDITKKKKAEDDEDKPQAKRPNLFNIQDEDKKPSPRKKIDSEKKKNNDDIDSKRKNKVAISKKTKKAKLMKPFNKLLEGVVLVISGIQNPERSNLRSMALSMGAKYKVDWDPTCTHLICAFPNTPKFNQVKGKGKIVTKSWVESCYNERKKIPWRRFALDKNDATQPESEDEIEELVDTLTTSRKSPIYQQIDDYEDDHKAEGSDTEEQVAKILQNKKRKKIQASEDFKIQNVSTDEESKQTSPKDDYTDIQQKNITSDLQIKNAFDADTDEESELSLKIRKTSPDIFQGSKFYVDQSFDEETYNTLTKYITAYNGKCFTDVTDDIDIIITMKENSSTMKEINAKAKCIKKSWIFKIHSKQEMLPITDFLI